MRRGADAGTAIPQQWDDDDFAPIAEAMDDVLASRRRY
jgi:hypothetical protein